MKKTYTKFNAGVWSDNLKGRYDLGKYESAAAKCDNFLPTRYGQVVKRGGTKYIGQAKGTGPVVLHRFQYSVTTKFILEFGHEYIRFWSNDLQVETAPDTPLEVTTPYQQDELDEIQIRAINDVVYIVHPNHPVARLTRIADDNWTFEADVLEPPFQTPRLEPQSTFGYTVEDVFTDDNLAVAPVFHRDGWVYYADANHRIARVRVDGTGDELVFQAGKAVNGLTLYGDYIYYTHASELRRVHVNGSNDELLYDDVSGDVSYRHVAVDDEYIFVTQNKANNSLRQEVLVRFDIDGGNMTPFVIIDGWGGGFGVDLYGDKVYFTINKATSSGGVWRIDRDGSNALQLHESNPTGNVEQGITASDDKLFMASPSDDTIVVMDHTGGNVFTIPVTAASYARDVHYSEGYLYITGRDSEKIQRILIDPQPGSIELTPSAVEGDITITANKDLFTPEWVGSELKLEYMETSSTMEVTNQYGANWSDNTLPDWKRGALSNATFSSSVVTNRDQVLCRYGALDKVHDYGTNVWNPSDAFANPETESTYYQYVGEQDLVPYASQVDGKTYQVGEFANITVNATGVGGPVSALHRCIEGYTASGTSWDTSKWEWMISPSMMPDLFQRGWVMGNREFEVTNRWSVKTTGRWNAVYSIQRSIDGGASWSTIQTMTSNSDNNFFVEDDEGGERSLIRVVKISSLTATDATQPSVDRGVHFTDYGGPDYGRVKITGYTDSKTVTATVLRELPSKEATGNWGESSFSPRNGYPRAICLFDNRVVLGGTNSNPLRIWYSAIGDYNNFHNGSTEADRAFFVTASSRDQSPIQWLSAQRDLFVGTSAQEGQLVTKKKDEAQSAENLPSVRWNESMGSAPRAVHSVRDNTLILQRGGRALNMMAYDLEKDGYTGEEVTLLCPHLFQSGINKIAHIREPYTGIYAVTNDGKLAHMIYEPKLQVTSWCVFSVLDGEIESCEALPSTDGGDEVWISVKRDVNGSPERMIERFVGINEPAEFFEIPTNFWYLDSAIRYDSPSMTTLTGLDHLEGREICVVADGVESKYTVTSGQVTLDSPCDIALAGLPITSEFEPLDLEAGEKLGGLKQLIKTNIMVRNSLGGKIASNGKDWHEVVYHVAGEPMDDPMALKDGYIEIFHESSHGRSKYWKIKHDNAYPFTLQAVAQTFTLPKK